MSTKHNCIEACRSALEYICTLDKTSQHDVSDITVIEYCLPQLTPNSDYHVNILGFGNDFSDLKACFVVYKSLAVQNVKQYVLVSVK